MNLGSGRLKLKTGMNLWFLCMCVCILHMYALKLYNLALSTKRAWEQ